MKAHIHKYWDRLRSSFWFLPSVMTGCAVVLAFASIALDESVMNQWLQSWAYAGGAEGASLVLGTIAGSMMTIAGVVFSMTLVALSLASSQFGSRLLRNFMRDTANQVVLGTFVSTFVYCLLVMRTIRRAEETYFVPHLSVTIGVLFALVSLGVLIYFIHHVAVSIQADEIVARVGAELIDAIDRLFPQQIGQEAIQPAAQLLDLGLAFSHESGTVTAAADGYLQFIDGNALMALAEQEDILLRLERRPGQYVVCGCPLAMAWPGDKVTEKFVEEVNSAFILGNQRTSAQDVEFAVHQLVEIAVRALSPGINDPFTAMACVDRLGSALCRVAQRGMPSTHRFDEQGQLRIVAPTSTFAGIVDAAFNQIRQYARSSAAVTIRLLETITVIAAATCVPQDQAALRRHAEMIMRGARDGLPEDEDRRTAEDRYQAANQALFKASCASPAH
ncbi:MAG: DUF2254 domain-containing protein [Burkholderiaceae bacterium]